MLRILKTIKSNPKHWNQENWHCGTSHCFAGFAELEKLKLPLKTSEEIMEKWFPVSDTFKVAKEYLQLTDRQAELLFHSNNSLNELDFIVKSLIKGISLTKIRKELIKHGVTINKHLSSKVTHVLYNGTTSFKYRQAKRTGIITLSENQFLERLKRNGIEIC